MTPPNRPAGFDRARLDALYGAIPGLLPRLLATFRASLGERGVALREALARDDACALGEQAHALKSAAGALTFTALQACAEEVEALARCGDPRLQVRTADLLAQMGDADAELGERERD